MRLLMAIVFGGLMPLPAIAASWQTDYGKALQLGREQDKPVLVYFCSSESAIEPTAAFARHESMLENYVPLLADRTTGVGRSLFGLFQITGESGFVIVERNQEWQFCRYQRSLSDDEIGQVLAKAVRASGKPVEDFLVRTSSLEAIRSQARPAVQSCLT